MGAFDKFNPQPKGVPKEKKSKVQAWNDLKLRAIKKRLSKKKEVNIEDEIFYKNCYAYFVTSGLWECENCGSPLKKYDVNDAEFTYKVRVHFHHILSKSKFPAFRHNYENIGVLCFSCHSKCESATSYPMTKVFKIYEERKKLLLK